MARVGEKIKRLRESRGWTQPHLAVEAGVAVSAVSQIENGRRSPNVGTLDKLAGAFGVEVVDLFQESEVPKAPSRSSTEPPEESEEERLLTRMIRRLIADLEADAERWESVALTGEVSLAVYKELVARRISVRSSLSDLDDASETLGVNISDRRGSPLRRVRRDLQSAFNRWNAARTVLIDLHFAPLIKAEEEAAEEEKSRKVTHIAEWQAEKNEAEQMEAQSNVISNVG